MIMSINQHGQEGLEELPADTVACLGCNIALLGGRLYYCEEIELLLEASFLCVSLRLQSLSAVLHAICLQGIFASWPQLLNADLR